MSVSANQAPLLRRLEEYPRDAVAAVELTDELLREGNAREAVSVLAECIVARGNARTSPGLCLRLGLLATAQPLQDPALGDYLMQHVDPDLRTRLTDVIVLLGASLSEALPAGDIDVDMAS